MPTAQPALAAEAAPERGSTNEIPQLYFNLPVL